MLNNRGHFQIINANYFKSSVGTINDTFRHTYKQYLVYGDHTQVPLAVDVMMIKNVVRASIPTTLF